MSLEKDLYIDVLKFLVKVSSGVKELSFPLDIYFVHYQFQHEGTSISEWLTHFVNLEYLNLTGGRFIGESDFVCHLPRLEVLNLRGCYNFAPVENLYTCENLIELDIRGCDWEIKTIVDLCKKLEKLEYLNALWTDRATPYDFEEIVASCPALRCLLLEPHCGFYGEQDLWERVVTVALLRGIRLSHAIMDVFPDGGESIMLGIAANEDEW